MKDKTILVSDVDGILTDGGHYYSSSGKFLKKFGSNDKDALKILCHYFERIIFISADKIGFEISYKRISEDWGYECFYVSTKERLDYLKNLGNRVVFVGDGLEDALTQGIVFKFITVKDATPQAQNAADLVLHTVGGKNVFPHLLNHINEIL